MKGRAQKYEGILTNHAAELKEKQREADEKVNVFIADWLKREDEKRKQREEKP